MLWWTITLIQVIGNSDHGTLHLTGGGWNNLQKLYRILLYVDSRGVPTTVPYPFLYGQSASPTTVPYRSLCGWSGSPKNWTVSFFMWTVEDSPQLDSFLLYVNSPGVPTAVSYPSLYGQSGSPHNWTVYFLWTIRESQRLDRILSVDSRVVPTNGPTS